MLKVLYKQNIIYSEKNLLDYIYFKINNIIINSEFFFLIKLYLYYKLYLYIKIINFIEFYTVFSFFKLFLFYQIFLVLFHILVYSAFIRFFASFTY